MISKIPPRRRDGKSSFKDLINYCLGFTGHAKNSVLHVGMKNLNSSPEKVYLEMEGLSYENPRCKNPVLHFILSWRDYESPTNEQVDEAVNIALKELNLEECQALWALQSDTDNLHVHVAVNRISPETFKPIRPAGGWTKKALERASRKIEFLQDWEVEQSGRYEINSSGQIFEKKEILQPEISQKARDIEAHTENESFERFAKRETAEILETAKSWDTLHQNLASKGFELERKGNGAILKQDDKAVKLSNISRNSSFSKLEQRLGKFQERKNDIIVKLQSKIFYEENSSDSKKLFWEKYQSEKNNYSEKKSSALKKLRERQKQERKNLCSQQKAERHKLFSQSWRERGNELNQLRSLFAFVHRKEILELRERQNKKIQELKSHFMKRFPSFKDWIAEQDNEDLYRIYRYPEQFILLPEQSGVKISQPRSIDLRNYSARRGTRGSVLYCRHGNFTADFSDTGKRIILNKKKLTEESVAAALQLANQKWGATQITGNAEYKELCIKAAVKYGLKLANPDLSAEVERRRNLLRPITAEEIAKLNLVENPQIYVNPRKDNQSYTGRIIHVDENRGYCVQLSGQRSLFVHQLEKLERAPLKGETLKISYSDENSVAKIQHGEIRRRTRSL